MSSALALENGRTERTALKVSGWQFAYLTFQTIGIIYSDIGTSPLYTLNGIWPANGPVPSKEDVIGGISAIIWSLTLVPVLKYAFISLKFGTGEGEGGAFALYQGLFPRQHYNAELERSLTGDSKHTRRSFTAKLSNKLRWPLLLWCFLGTALTLADGVFTPAVSVTSAVGGIAVAKASVSSHIIPISIGFLVVLFLAQPFGTARIASVFAPIAVVWMALIGICGIANVVAHPGIFRAFDPSRAIMLFVRTKNYDLLSGIILALTGSEALFANLGQFNALSIRVSMAFFVYPCLCFAYLGQGARIIRDGESVMSNIFYNTIPGPDKGALFWISYVLAILATLVASQAMITATFSLGQQLVNMRSLPPLSMVYTSETVQGQVYIPALNWALMVVTIIIVAAFKSSTALANAYGFSVATAFITTTVLIAIQMRYVKGWPVIVGIAFFIIFGFIDALFWGASLKKVPEGAWVPLMIGVILMIVMTFWTWAKGLEDRFDGANRRNLRSFIIARDDNNGHQATFAVGPSHAKEIQQIIDDGIIEGTETHPPSRDERSVEGYYYMASKLTADADDDSIKEKEQKRELVRIESCAIFHKLSSGSGVPHSFVGFIRQWPALPRVTIFLSVRMLPIARVPTEDRYIVNKVNAVEGFYAASYYLGFRDHFDVKIDAIVDRICAIEARDDPVGAAHTIAQIREWAHSATHIVPHYHVVSKPVGGRSGAIGFAVDWIRSILIENVYRHLSAMFPETKNWLSSADEIIHVGINAAI